MSRSLSMKIMLILCIIYTGSSQSDRRQDISRMSPEDVNQFRANVRRMQDSGQWVNLASDHGVPNQYCPHGNLRFLPWHRRQIARIEELLGQKLPYWDWTRTNGIPESCRDPTYTDAQGNQVPNPLYSAPRVDGQATTRQPIADFNIGSLQSQEQMAMSSDRFEQFSTAVEGAHNDIHGNIGGDMNTLDYSAFDPIFWLHHCNVDRIWYRWQRRNRFAMYPDVARGELQDSVGVFMGEDSIQDLSGWIPNGTQPTVASSQTPTMSETGSVRGTGPNGASDNGNQPQPAAGGNQPQPAAGGNQPQPARRGRGGNSFQTLAWKNFMPMIGLPRWQTFADEDDNAPKQDHKHGGPPAPSPGTNVSAAGVYLPVIKSVRHQLHSLQAPLEIVTAIEDDVNLRTTVEEPGYQPQNRSVMAMKGMEAGPDPLRVDIYFFGQLIGWVQTFGMGRSNMTYKMDRFVDITTPVQSQHCANDQIKDKLQFRVTNQRTGQVDMGKTFDLELKNMIF